MQKQFIFNFFLILSAILLSSCEEDHEEIMLNMISIIGDASCNHTKCAKKIDIKNKKIDIETFKLSSMDLIIDHHLFLRVLENSELSIESTEKQQYITLKKGKILVANQKRLVFDKIFKFNLRVSTLNHSLDLSEYTYISLETDSNSDKVEVLSGLLRVKLKNQDEKIVKVYKNSEKEGVYKSPISFALEKNHEMSTILSLEPAPMEYIKENIHNLLKLSTTTPFLSKVTKQYSPNYDGEEDVFIIEPLKRLKQDIEGWNMSIYDSQYRLMKRFVSPWRNDLDEDNSSFNTIIWDMINKNGELIKEQKYIYYLESINDSTKDRQIFEVDLTPPFAEITLPYIGFSPNHDSVKDVLEINTHLDTNATWMLYIKKNQEIVYQQILDANIKKVIWDGKSNDGTGVLEDDKYSLEIIGLDACKNKRVFQQDIYIDNKKHSIMVKSDTDFFSPNDDGFKDHVTFYFQKQDIFDVHSWHFYIRKDHQIIRSWNGLNDVDKITWDGKNNDGQYVADGKYEYEILSRLNTGDEIKSIKQLITLDTSPPIVKIELSGEYDNFTPDDLFENNQLEIKHDIQDQSPIDHWALNVYQGDVLLQTIEGSKKPESPLYWFGVTKYRQLESFEDYDIELVVTDEMKLVGKSSRHPFSTGAILKSTDMGYLIRISSILFESGNANLTGEKTFVIIDKMAKALKKFKKYNLIIQGHTDSDGEKTGFDNVKLSFERAKSVKNAILERSLAITHIDCDGKGFGYPVVHNEQSEYDKQRNRRVDFLLNRK
jgi:outer membrane protein OmpA-like peptidoglycan-associated protein